jgi:DNA-binding transcriptional ArsR family regulator
MNTPDSAGSSPQNQPKLPFNPLIGAIGEPTRWAILSELSLGEPLMVKELAQKLRRSPTLISKHLAVLRKAGAVVIGRGGLYQIPSHFLTSKENRHVDFGHCLLRLPKSVDEEQ